MKINIPEIRKLPFGAPVHGIVIPDKEPEPEHVPIKQSATSTFNRMIDRVSFKNNEINLTGTSKDVTDLFEMWGVSPHVTLPGIGKVSYNLGRIHHSSKYDVKFNTIDIEKDGADQFRVTLRLSDLNETNKIA